jgi:phage/plasmid-like protein (TIGR03299 family)
VSHEFDSGAFYREGAWHGLGTVIQEKQSTGQFMKAAGMDWQVESFPLFNEDGTKVEGWQQLRRSDTGELLHVAKSTWMPVQNEESFTWFDPFIQDGDLFLSAAVSLKGGKRIALTAEFTQPVQADVVQNDPVQLKLVLFNSHDGSLAVGVKFTPIRVVCANTLAMVTQGEQGNFVGEVNISARSARIKHTKNVSTNLVKVREQIDLARRCFQEVTVPQYQAMSNKELTTELWRVYLAQLFEKEDVNNVHEKLRAYDGLTEKLENGAGQNLPGVRGTMWGAYNAVTEWCKDKGNVDSVLFGTYNRTIQRAHELALSLA